MNGRQPIHRPFRKHRHDSKRIDRGAESRTRHAHSSALKASTVARPPTPAQADALAAFSAQLESIKQLFVGVDRQNERFALYGVETPPQPTASISIDEWGALLGAVKARLRLTAGEMHRAGFNDTPDEVRASVLECVDALDQLHAMLGDALSAFTPPERRPSEGASAIGTRRAGAHPHVSGVPVSASPLLNCARAAVAND